MEKNALNISARNILWPSVCLLLSRAWLFVTPWTAAHQAPQSLGFFQARILEWFAISFSLDYYQPQLCPTLWDPMDSCRPLGSSIHGILQARVVEWVAISFSRGSSWLRDRTRVSRIVGRCFTVWATREVQYSILYHPHLLFFFIAPIKIWFLYISFLLYFSQN